MANIVKLIATVAKRSNCRILIKPNLIVTNTRYFCTPKNLARHAKTTTREPQSQIFPQDHLMDSLKLAVSTTEILDTVKKNAPTMSSKETIQALRTLFALQKKGHSEMSTAQILKHPSFETICGLLKKHSGVIELNETLEALKVLCFVGVSSNAAIVETLLHLLRHRLNLLSLNHIAFLHFLLTQSPQSPLGEALKLSLPILFEIQLPQKLDADNIQQVAECLHFASRTDLSDDCVRYILDCIKDYKKEIDSKTLVSLLWSMCDFKPKGYFKSTVTRLINDMLTHIEEYDYRDLDTMLSKMITRYNHIDTFYYSDVFCDTVANCIIDHNIGLDNAVHVLNRFQKVGHSHYKLVDYVAKKVHDFPEEFANAPVMTYFNLINSLAMYDYRPPHWDTVKHHIEKTQVFKNLEKNREILWLKLAMSLITLDIYKADVMGMAFNRMYLNKITKKVHISDIESLILIKQLAHTFKPDFLKLLPDNSDQWAGLIWKRDYYPLEGPLQLAYGGEQYVRTYVTSKLDHAIDHVIAFDKSGSPVPLNRNARTLDELTENKDVQLVAILVMQPYNYTSNTKQIKPRTALSIKTLEYLNCTVVPVNINSWMELQDFERIPYLTQIIKSKLSENEPERSVHSL